MAEHWIDADNRYCGDKSAAKAHQQVPFPPPAGKGGDYYWDNENQTWVFDGRVTRSVLESEIITLRKDLDAATVEGLTTRAGQIQDQLNAKKAELAALGG